MEGAAQAEETGNRGDARFPVSEPHIDGIAVDVCYKFSHRKVAHSLYGYGVIKAGIVDAWFGEILRSPLLQWGQWTEKHKFQPDSHKPWRHRSQP